MRADKTRAAVKGKRLEERGAELKKSKKGWVGTPTFLALFYSFYFLLSILYEKALSRFLVHAFSLVHSAHSAHVRGAPWSGCLFVFRYIRDQGFCSEQKT